MPDSLRNGNGTNSNLPDLKLRGDKIKLETRPASREGLASFRSSLAGGHSRPVSAIPMLRLYNSKDDYELSQRSRRPYSADVSQKRSKRFYESVSRSTSSLQNIEEFSTSSEVFKELIAEPIVSWRQGEQILKSKKDVKEECRINLRDCYSEETLSSATDLSETCALTPGLVGKPPLPKKDGRKCDGGKSKRVDEFDVGGNQACSNFEELAIMKDQNFEAYNVQGKATKKLEEQVVADNGKKMHHQTPLLLKPEDENVQHKGLLTKNVEEHSAENLRSYADNEIKPQRFEVCKTENPYFDEIRRESASKQDVGKIENRPSFDDFKKKQEIVQYQNWIEDSKTHEEQTNALLLKVKLQQMDLGIQSDAEQLKVDESEKRTDFLLDKLKQQQLSLGLDVEDELPQKLSPKTKHGLTFESFFADAPPPVRVERARSTKVAPPKKKPEVKPKNGVKFAQQKGKFKAKNLDCHEDAVEAKVDEELSWMSKGVDSPIKSPVSCDVPERDCEETTESTCDEIEAILEVLEAENKKSQSKMQDIKKIVSVELNATINSIPNNGTSKNEPQVKCGTPTQEKSHGLEVVGSKCSTISNGFKDILTYLDEIDRSNAQSISNAKERVMLANQMIDGSIKLDTIPKLEDLLSHTQVELANQIIDLNLRLKEKSSSIRLLQEELSNVREHVLRTTRQTENVVKEKLNAQKEETDAIVRRHQKFIDQLIADKKGLNQQCEALVHEMRAIEEKYVANARAAEHRHQVELQKAKEMQAAGEKIRRERWIDSRTQKIKEMTVKSIEPEIQSMTTRHEQELADLRAIHKREIEDIELKNARKMQQQCEALREQLTEEREKALAHEREVMRIRYESMVDTEQKGYQEQRKRLLQEHANRMAECEGREMAAVAEKERIVKQMQEEYEDKLQAAIRRHAGEIKLLKDTTEMEMETWKANCAKQQEAQLARKERSIREQCKRERDREIENVIERLESEAQESGRQIEEAAEGRIRRIKEKYENEVKDLEMSEKESKSKYTEMKTKLLESEDEVINLKAAVKNLEMQLKETQELYEKLSSEKGSMRENLREEMKVEISSLEKEIERIKNDRDVELQQVYARVKVAVARKDEMLGELSRDNMALKEKCRYLESMLEQQRKEYLIK